MLFLLKLLAMKKLLLLLLLATVVAGRVIPSKERNKGRSRGSKQNKKNRKESVQWSGLTCFLVCHIFITSCSC